MRMAQHERSVRRPRCRLTGRGRSMRRHPRPVIVHDEPTSWLDVPAKVPGSSVTRARMPGSELGESGSNVGRSRSRTDEPRSRGEMPGSRTHASRSRSEWPRSGRKKPGSQRETPGSGSERSGSRSDRAGIAERQTVLDYAIQQQTTATRRQRVRACAARRIARPPSTAPRASAAKRPSGSGKCTTATEKWRVGAGNWLPGARDQTERVPGRSSGLVTPCPPRLSTCV